jgi:hypothetical protein
MATAREVIDVSLQIFFALKPVTDLSLKPTTFLNKFEL